MFLIRTIYYILVSLCIGISLYLTYYGFEQTFGNLTLAFTAVIGLLLFAADYLIQRNRERGLPWMPAFMLFLMAAVFSTISNFNFLYTNFMTTDVLSETVRSQYDVFKTDLTDTRTTLDSLDVMQEEANRRASIETELAQMWSQMSDDSRPGCGERCGEHINAINALLGVTITDLARPGPSSTEAERKSFYDNFRGLVGEAQVNSNVAGPYQAISVLISKIDERLTFYGNPDDALRAGANLSILAKLSQDSQQVEREANTLLISGEFIEHTFIDPTLGRLGEIVYSLKNGLVEVPNLGASIMALILSIVLDFIPIIFALVAFRPGESFTADAGNDDFDVLNGKV